MTICATCYRLVGGPFECDCDCCDGCGQWFPAGEYLIDNELSCCLCIDCANMLIERMK